MVVWNISVCTFLYVICGYVSVCVCSQVPVPFYVLECEHVCLCMRVDMSCVCLVGLCMCVCVQVCFSVDLFVL